MQYLDDSEFEKLKHVSFGLLGNWCGYDPNEDFSIKHHILMNVAKIEMKNLLEEVELDMEHVLLGLLNLHKEFSSQISILGLEFKDEYFVRRDAVRYVIYLEDKGVDKDFAHKQLCKLILNGKRKPGVYTKRITARCVAMRNTAYKIAKNRSQKYPQFLHYFRACLLMESSYINRLFVELEMEREY